VYHKLENILVENVPPTHHRGENLQRVNPQGQCQKGHTYLPLVCISCTLYVLSLHWYWRTV